MLQKHSVSVVIDNKKKKMKVRGKIEIRNKRQILNENDYNGQMERTMARKSRQWE